MDIKLENNVVVFNVKKHIRITAGVDKVLMLMKIEHEVRKIFKNSD